MTWITHQPLPKPPRRQEMLVTVKQPWGLDGQPFIYNTTIAIYIRRLEVESYNSEYDPSFEDYDEARDEYFLPEGWYEVHTYHPENGLSRINYEIVAMQPMPKAWQPEEGSGDEH